MKYTHLHQRLTELEQNDAMRTSRALNVDGILANDLVNFSSNDYLGLASNVQLQTRFFAHYGVARPNWMSASSSRPLTGTRPYHAELESLIADSYKKTGALTFNSGYHANTGILPAITGKGDLILADKLVHASLIDGLKLGHCDFKRFSHNNTEHLESLLATHRKKYRDVWIVTESLFSMDGDYASLADIVDLKNKYQSFLYVDEAHALGCLGERGLGLADELGLTQDIDIIVGTFGKALTGCGGFAVADQTLISAMINFSRAWLFSTALPPINTLWNLYIWQQIGNFGPQRKKLFELTNDFKLGLKQRGFNYVGDSYIVPIIEAGNRNVVALSEKMQAAGVLAMPIRSPTVRPGTERIRFSLTANMTKEALNQCLQSLHAL